MEETARQSQETALAIDQPILGFNTDSSRNGVEITMPATLASIPPGQAGFVRAIRCNGLLRRRLLDLGMIPGARVESVMRSPAGDPTIYEVHGTQLALRQVDARQVLIGPAPSPSPQGAPAVAQGCSTAGCASGCGAHEAIAPRGDSEFHYIVALAGNPNTGKSTVFNALTGLHQHVGNWPGKTVSRAEGWWAFDGRRYQVVDLPGTYSLLSTSTDEEIARDFVLFGAPDCTVVVVDATCLQRHLNLAMQIMEITNRVVLCVNLIDEAARKGLRIDGGALERDLGVPVVLTAARSGRGLDELRQRIDDVATGRVQPRPLRLALEPELEEAVAALAAKLETAMPGLPNARWIALQLIDGGDHRLREEIASGVLGDLAGRIGDTSLGEALSPNRVEARR